MKVSLLAGFLVGLSVVGAACAPTTVRTESAKQIAACPVCTYNNELACETVVVTATTPSVVHDGKTYHFCSEHCRAKFLEDPEAYLSE